MIIKLKQVQSKEIWINTDKIIAMDVRSDKTYVEITDKTLCVEETPEQIVEIINAKP